MDPSPREVLVTVALTGGMTIEPLANAVDQLTLEKTQAPVLWCDN
jgi:hypothetical protein